MRAVKCTSCANHSDPLRVDKAQAFSTDSVAKRKNNKQSNCALQTKLVICTGLDSQLTPGSDIFDFLPLQNPWVGLGLAIARRALSATALPILSSRKTAAIRYMIVNRQVYCCSARQYLRSSRMADSPGANSSRQEERLRQDVDRLAHGIGERNLYRYAELCAAAAFVEQSFRGAGYQPMRQEYEARAKASPT
jgi:hypothetical protein